MKRPGIDANDFPFATRPLTEAKGGGYLIAFPDLPGHMSDVETVEESISIGREAQAVRIAAMQGAGAPPVSWRQPVPERARAEAG